MKILKIITAILIAILFINASLHAQQQRISYEKKPQNQQALMPVKPDFSKLNLTEDQQDQIKILEEEHKSITQPLHEKMREKDEAIKRLKASGQDKSKLKKLYNERCAIKSEIDAERVIFHQKIKSLLTEDQLIEFQKNAAR